MKKVFIILGLVLLTGFMPVMAKNVKVEALSDFSTEKPSKTWSVKLVDDMVTNDGTVYYAGSVIHGNIVGVTDPKRLKRNASFTFIPVTYYDARTKQSYNIKNDFEGKYSVMTDVTPLSVAKTGAIAAGNHFISGFIGPSIALVEGTIKNEEGNRAKSAVVSVYESTPLSYASKGKQLDIKKGQIFVMSFKLMGEEESVENKPNYEYTIEK